MTITDSQFQLGEIQRDGRRFVRERHLAATGEEFVFAYLASAGVDYTAVMQARKTDIETRETARETTEAENALVKSVERRMWQTLNGKTDLELATLFTLTAPNLVRMRRLIAEKM